MTDEKRTDDIGGGLGIGLGFSAGGLVCLLVVPDYLEASTGWTTFWHTVGGLLGVGGIAGVLTELSKVQRLEGAGYVAAALVIAAPAGVLHLLQGNAVVAAGAATAFRVAAVLLVLFALTGLGMGLGRLAASVAAFPVGAKGAGSWRVTSLSFITAITGLVTAVLNFLQV